MTADFEIAGDDAYKFVLHTDQAPEFWQFLNGLRGDDLLVELIVNELDARSSHTEIRFEPDRLICIGNGDPIDADGWKRLSFIKGAGYAVAAKVGLFGVKNHGLKACFTIGNNILLRSSGQQILQTLFANGPDAAPYPGVRIPPLADAGAPNCGTAIEVAYRRTPFTVPYGEQLPFAAVTDAHIAALFTEAVATLPKRMLGIMRPGVLDEYTLTLTHHALGTHRFAFCAGRIKREAGLLTFFRDSRETANGTDVLLEREQACLALLSADDTAKPRFFQASTYKIGPRKLFARDGLVVEVAWDVNAKGKPRLGTGRLRYPVAYPGSDVASSSGTGCFYSGPFISDTERHELAAQSSDANDAIVASCDGVLASVLAKVLIPRHGARALTLLGPLTGDRLLSIANHLLKAHALSAVDYRGRAVRHKRGTKLVVPAYDHAHAAWEPLLARVAPANLPILDPKTPATLVALLAERLCDGCGENHERFDGKDVLDRMEGVETEYFPWRNDAEWRRTLGDPSFARAHLDAIQPYLATFKTTVERPEGSAVYLPDSEHRLHRLSDLKRGAAIPTELLELDVPPVVHPDLKGHPVFKLDGWKLEGYVLRELLRDGRIECKSQALRRKLFGWIADQPDELGRDDWPAVKALPIWPSIDGNLYAFEALCLPNAKLAEALGNAIARPTREVRALSAKRKNKKPRLVLRDEPTAEEIARFYEAGTARFCIGAKIPLEQSADFHAFEKVLVAVGRNKQAASLLRALRDDAIALDRDGVVRPAHALVRETPEVRFLHLQAKDLLNRPDLELDQILPPARRAGARMTFDALRDDTANSEALLPRLAIITRSADLAILDNLGSFACLPFGGELVAPNALAFKGNQGEYWGGWKAVIGAQGLSDNAQELYRAAGVIRSFPNAETSRAYFKWLNEQPAAMLAVQISCIMRHILNRNGVASWLFQPPEVPCVPVEDGGGVRLLTLSEARKTAVVDDVRELGDAIRMAAPNARLALAIDSVRVPNEPIGDILKEWGILALSSVAKEPGNPDGSNVEPASTHFFETVRGLAGTAAAKRFRKQLAEADVQQNMIEPRFQHKLLAIKRVMVATDLTVQYRFRGRSYRASRPWAVLPDEIWLDRAGTLDDTLMEAIADIVFKKPRPRYLGIVLKGALSQRAQDFQPVFKQAEQDDYDDDADEKDVGESEQPHPGSAPQPERNNPNPGELYAGGQVRMVTRGPTSKRKQVVAEDIQRKQLKRQHYAAHCQMELAVKPLEVLAPAGSYAEYAENRIWMVQAHHPDKTSTQGARHAGNLLILSKVNHDAIGTRLSRADITDALRSRWSPHQILKPDGSVWLDGGITGAIDKVTGEVIPFFFTRWHRDYWLEMTPD